MSCLFLLCTAPLALATVKQVHNVPRAAGHIVPDGENLASGVTGELAGFHQVFFAYDTALLCACVASHIGMRGFWGREHRRHQDVF